MSKTVRRQRRIKNFPVVAAICALVGCSNQYAEVDQVVLQDLLVPAGAKIKARTFGKVGSTDYACLTVYASNRLGAFSESEVPLIKDVHQKWQKVNFGDLAHISCLSKWNADLTGARDSVPSSMYPKDASTLVPDVRVPFDRREVKFADGYGDNIVEGSAAVKDRSGSLHFCLDEDDGGVNLVPVSRYAAARFGSLFGNVERGYNFSNRLVPGDPLYLDSIRTTGCDSRGRFFFKNIPDGDYFVTAGVTWAVQKTAGASGVQGGGLMQRVQLRRGEDRKLALRAP